MSNPPLRVRALPGRVYTQDATKRWFVEQIDKVHCGAVARVTSLKFGDIRSTQDIAIVRVRGREIGVPVQRIRLFNER